MEDDLVFPEPKKRKIGSLVKHSSVLWIDQGDISIPYVNLWEIQRGVEEGTGREQSAMKSALTALSIIAVMGDHHSAKIAKNAIDAIAALSPSGEK